MQKENILMMQLFLFLLVIPLVTFAVDDRIPSGEGGDYDVIIMTKAQAEQWYNVSGFEGYRSRMVLGQSFIGHGADNSISETTVCLGYLCMLNSKPAINNTAVNANKTLTKHPYTNDTLVCEINITDKDVGDKIWVHVTWYKNSSSWYPNNETVEYSDLDKLVEEYNVSFERWEHNDESWNHTIIAKTFYSVNTTPFRIWQRYDSRWMNVGSIQPNITKHYDLWKCSVNIFDYTAYSGWFDSKPIFIYNRQPDYNEYMPTYYSWDEDTVFYIDLGSNFSDIDGDDINWYINYTSGVSSARFGIRNISIEINNETGIVTLIPNSNIAGTMDIMFTGVDNNESHTSDWYLENDYGQTNTNMFSLNVLQVNDRPWASDVYIHSPNPNFRDNLYCRYTYNDIESHPENLLVTSFKWFKQEGGVGPWYDFNHNNSVLSPSQFNLGDKLICSVRVKDIYNLWQGYSWLKIDGYGRVIANTRDNRERIYQTLDSVIESNKWYHIVNTVDLNNNQRKIYVDGELKSFSDQIVENLGDYLNWRLGQRFGSFEGLMDEVGIWSRVLSYEEILDLYRGDRFGVKYFDSDLSGSFTETEAIIRDNDGDNLYTHAPDQIFVPGTYVPQEGDYLYSVDYNDKIFSDNINLELATCIYSSSDISINDGIADEYYLGEDCADYYYDHRILSSYNWSVSDKPINQDTAFIKESVPGSLTFSSTADTIITLASGSSDMPSPGEPLTMFKSEEVYYDINENNVYNHGEPIIYDNNCDLEYLSSDDNLILGSGVPENSELKRFSSGIRTYPFVGSFLTDLDAYYDMDGNVLDSVSNNHGSSVGTSNSNEGRSCQSREFSKNYFINLPFKKEDVYSISMWVKFEELPSIPWIYTPENKPATPWLYSEDDLDQSLWQEGYTNSSVVSISIQPQSPVDEGQIVIGVG